jgi:hypothetical protein
MHRHFLALAAIALAIISLAPPASGQLGPVPFINNPLVPARVAPGSAAFTLTINGNGLTSTSAVYWNGSLRPSTLISSHQIQAQIYATDVANAGFGWVSVSNQGIGSAFSNVAYLEIGNTAEGAGFQLIPFDIPFTYSMAVGDFNNDGILDFVVNYQSGRNESSMAVYLGKGNGSFKPPLTSVRGEIRSMVVGDFNGDGNLDIAAAGPSLRVLLGNGDGTFSLAPKSPVSSIANVYAAADFHQSSDSTFIRQRNITVRYASRKGRLKDLIRVTSPKSGCWSDFFRKPGTSCRNTNLDCGALARNAKKWATRVQASLRDAIARRGSSTRQ